MVRRTLRLSVLEGSAWALMVGLGELFFVADAVRLGADRLFAAAVVVVPLLAGSLGGLLGLWALRHASNRRPFTVAVVTGQIAVLVALAVADGLQLSSPWLLLAAACAYYACGSAAGPAWSSWMGQLVPRRLRGRYFGRRNRWIHLCTFGGLLLGGSVLGVTGALAIPASTGFAILFGLAALARVVSAVLLWASSELDFEPPGPANGLRAVLRGRLPAEARRVVRTSALITVAVAVASPFFAPFMLIDLGFSYVEYTLAQAAVVAGKVVSLPYFGARLDRSGPVGPWRTGAVGVALVPLPWLLVGGLPGVAACQVLSGLSWGAYEVSQLALLLGATSDKLRAPVFALQSLWAGVAMAAGAAVGSALLLSGAPVVGVFATSAGLRAVVVAASWSLPRGLPGRRDATRVVGMRPQMGLATRPMLGGSDPARPAREPGDASDDPPQP